MVNAHDGIEPVPSSDPLEVHVNGQPAFADKTVDGKSLFNRTEGKSFALSSGANTCNFVMPWPIAKFNGVEIIGGELGDVVNLKVLDSTTGTYTTIPNYQLNQFGYSVNVRPDYYVRESTYDADLFLGMQISIEYTSSSAKTIYFNYMLHELK